MSSGVFELSGALGGRGEVAYPPVIFEACDVAAFEPPIPTRPCCCGEQAPIFFGKGQLPAIGFVVGFVPSDEYMPLIHTHTLLYY
jgi:hypothetical protein